MPDCLRVDSMTDDDVLFQAVLANPADDAPRLIYADWLDERNDPRGEYLRVDLELARSTVRDGNFKASLRRARELRLGLDRTWVVVVSTGPSGVVMYLDLFRRDETDEWPEGDEIFLPTWKAVESGFRGLNRADHYFARIRFGSSYKKHDWVYAMGGPDAIELVGRIHREHCRFRNTAGQPGRWYSVGISTTDEPHMCFDMDTVIRAVKWAYYHREFGPGLWTCHQPVRPAGRSNDELATEIARLRELIVHAGSDLETIP
jgi:uncharacterized protein (TIGR02996 family)